PFVDRPHCLPPSSRLSSGGRPGPVKSFPCVLSPKRGDIRWYPKVAAHVSHRAPTHQTQTSISTTRRKPIFILGGAEEAWVVSPDYPTGRALCAPNPFLCVFSLMPPRCRSCGSLWAGTVAGCPPRARRGTGVPDGRPCCRTRCCP